MNAVTPSTAVAKIAPKSVLLDMSNRYGMEPAAFEQTLRATVVPKDCSREQFAAFLLVAREYKLNPMTKEIYAFPARGGGIQPIVSIDGWLNIINSHPSCNGFEFDDHLDKDGKVTAITAKIWRKDRDKPVTVTEYMGECTRDTDTWKKYPRRMLRHKALIQCARYAFGFAGIYDPDEAERIEGATIDHDDGPPAPPAARAIEHQQPEAATDQVVWEENSERPATAQDFAAPDDGDIPAILDRRNEKPKANAATAADVFDPADWLKQLDAAFAGCEDSSGLAEAQQKLMTPYKEKAFPPDYTKAKALIKKHLDRINSTILDAG